MKCLACDNYKQCPKNGQVIICNDFRYKKKKATLEDIK